MILKRIETSEWKTQCLIHQRAIGGQKEKGEASVLGGMRKKSDKNAGIA